MELADFLSELAQNPNKLNAFKQNPQQVMTAAGLSEADQAVLGFNKGKSKTGGTDNFYQNKRFYLDFDDGSVVFQLYTAAKNSTNPQDLLSVSTAWKQDDDQESPLQIDTDPVQQTLNNNKTTFYIEGGSDIAVPTSDETTSQRSNAIHLDKSEGNLDGTTYNCEILHIKVKVDVTSANK